PGDDPGPDRHGPFVAAADLAVPGGAVVRDGVDVLGHVAHPRCRAARGQSSAGSVARASGASGRVIRKVAPRAGAVSTLTVPPCAATSAATIARPSPLPPVRRPRAWSAR